MQLMNNDKDNYNMKPVLRLLAYQQAEILRLLEEVRQNQEYTRTLKSTKFDTELMKKKKFIRFNDGKDFYNIGLTYLRELATEAGAIVQVKRVLWLDVDKMNKYLEAFYTKGM